MASQASNIKISPVDVTWNIEETVCVDTKGIVAANLNGLYFNIYDASTEYNVFFDLDAAGTPNPGAGTGIEVDVVTGETAASIASKIEIAVEAATGYDGTLDGTQVMFVLDVTDEVATDAADVDSGIDVTVVHKGGNTDLGLLDGNVEPSFGEELLDVTAHQTGTTVLTQLRQGFTVTLDLTLKECKKSVYRDLIKAAGGTFTPGGGVEVFGWGKESLGKNTIKNARRLNLSPVNETTEDNDLTFWLAYPQLSSILYSGEEEQKLSVTFTAFLDDTKPDAVSLFVYGDSTQTGL